MYIFVVVLLLLLAFGWSRIYRRLGWNQWWGLAMVVPFAYLVAVAVLYFQRWPLEQRIAELEEEV